MLSARAVGWGLTVVSVAGAMSSLSGSTCAGCRGLGAPAGPRDARSLSPPQELHRLGAVPGRDPNRTNDMLLLPPQIQDHGSASKHVVFFHGDIQNFHEEMALHSDAAPWVGWSLEQAGRVLGRRFPDSHIWVVRASRMYLHKFSCYQHFVQCNMFGAPEHSGYEAGQGAFCQLRSLLSNAMTRANLPHPLPPPEGSDTTIPPGFSLTLVGFSKGCVVLNQLVYELPGAQSDPLMSEFVQRISDMFWLDGGHPGGSETWVTNKAVLKELASSGISVHAHVTPYEVCDPMRAWVGREHEVFVKTLEEFGACPSKKLHFEDEPPSIENHFRVIQEF
ncbi:mitochondrial protein C2orf69 homolog [Periophthalmus magnuspinnatus]|uniref:mitochondrial protein C2orf69 homolog n=1 Tax=Periophthalmus magnuspinnatus TaxID=409849 RepID=UPI00145A045E|nr:mitochondrial protein C2orf69 homolog [Periophthalmus magnuspinnatus]